MVQTVYLLRRDLRVPTREKDSHTEGHRPSRSGHPHPPRPNPRKLTCRTRPSTRPEAACGDDVKYDDRQHGEEDRRHEARDVDPVLALELLQRKRQRGHVLALGQNQGNREIVPDLERVVDDHRYQGGA